MLPTRALDSQTPRKTRTSRRPSLGAPAGRDTWDGVRAKAAYSGDDFALFVGDAGSALAQLPDGSINTCLTSPPYWAARDYGSPEQIGLEDEVDDYVKHVVAVYRDVYRVLAKDGTAWLNIGDSYFNRTITKGGMPPRFGWKRSKQLSLVPFRVAIALEEDRWWVRNVVVWQKPNAMPASVTDRLANSWEPMFLLAKRESTISTLMRFECHTSPTIQPSVYAQSLVRRMEKQRGATI